MHVAPLSHSDARANFPHGLLYIYMTFCEWLERGSRNAWGSYNEQNECITDLLFQEVVWGRKLVKCVKYFFLKWSCSLLLRACPRDSAVHLSVFSMTTRHLPTCLCSGCSQHDTRSRHGCLGIRPSENLHTENYVKLCIQPLVIINS